MRPFFATLTETYRIIRFLYSSCWEWALCNTRYDILPLYPLILSDTSFSYLGYFSHMHTLASINLSLRRSPWRSLEVSLSVALPSSVLCPVYSSYCGFPRLQLCHCISVTVQSSVCLDCSMVQQLPPGEAGQL